MANQSLSSNGKAFLQGFDTLCLQFYGDSKGYPTVGYGHLISRSYTYTKNTTGNPNDSLLTQTEANNLKQNLNLSYGSPITQAYADTLFTNDTASAIAAVNKLVPTQGGLLTQSQFDALVSLCFNGGSGALQTSDVKALLACPFMFTNLTSYAHDTDLCSTLVSRAFSYDPSLKTRRNKEATLFCSSLRYTHKYPVYTL